MTQLCILVVRTQHYIPFLTTQAYILQGTTQLYLLFVMAHLRQTRVTIRSTHLHSWHRQTIFVFHARCHLLDFDSYAPCNDVIFSQSTRGFHSLQFECPENLPGIIAGSVSSYKLFVRIVQRLIVNTFLCYQNRAELTIFVIFILLTFFLQMCCIFVYVVSK